MESSCAGCVAYLFIGASHHKQNAYNYAPAYYSLQGYNGAYTIGDGEDGERLSPSVPVVGISGVRKVVAAGSWSCATLADDTVKCWGGRNSAGEVSFQIFQGGCCHGKNVFLMRLVYSTLGLPHPCISLLIDWQRHVRRIRQDP